MVIRDSNIQLDPKVIRKEHPSSKKLLLASPLDRMAAFVIDHLIILSPVIMVFCSPFERQLKEAWLIGNELEAIVAGITLAVMALSILMIYHTVFVHMVGGTLGQLIMGLRVVRFWDQKNLGLWNSCLRTIVWVANLIMFGLPTLAVFSDTNRRAWYDRLSDSLVITVRPKRSEVKPSMYHRSMVQGFFAALILFMIFAVGNTLITNIQAYSYTDEIAKILEEEEVYCQIVGEAQEEWPKENGKEASRVSVALGLFFADQIGYSCLESEFDSRGYASQEDSLARLTKAMLYYDHDELSDLYLNSVCDADREGAPCRVSKAMLSLDESDIKEHRDQLFTVSTEDPVYAQLWAINYLLDIDEFQQAEKLVDNLPKSEYFKESLLPMETKILWGMKGHEAAEGAAKVALNLIEGEGQAELSSWLCYEELSMSCEAWDSGSCESFEELVKSEKELLNYELTSMAYLTKKECEDPSGVNYIGLMASEVTQATKDLIKAKMTNDVESFREISFDKNYSLRHRAESMRELLDNSNDKEDFMRVYSHWTNSGFGPSFKKVGGALLTYYMENRDYEMAIQIAEKMYKSGKKLRQSVWEKYVVAEYNMGRHLKAKEILSDYKVNFPSKWIQVTTEDSSRSPASLNEFKMVVRSLK